jgi:hypothetical protein
MFLVIYPSSRKLPGRNVQRKKTVEIIIENPKKVSRTEQDMLLKGSGITKKEKTHSLLRTSHALLFPDSLAGCLLLRHCFYLAGETLLQPLVNDTVGIGEH